MENNDSQTIIKVNGPISLNTSVELPIDGLPPSIQQYIEAVYNVYHCPREFITVAVLATAATAVGKKIRIVDDKYDNNLVLWFVSVARSGSNKTYPMRLVTAPLRDIDKILYKKYREEDKAYKAVPAKDRVGDGPKCPGIVIDDCTDERRSEILFLNSDTAGESEDSTDKRDSQRGAIGIYPELKGMFDSKNQYQNGGTTGISKLLRLFDCEDIKVDRKNGLTLLIHNPFCNILGDLQTGMLRQTFGSELFMTNGLNQRFLFCIAENIEYPKRSHERLPNDIYWQWKQTVNMLYENIYHSPNGEHLTLFRCTDGIVTLSESANRLYDDYYNSLQLKKEASQSDYESAIYSKLQIQVIRLAGIVHALQVAEEKGQRQDYTSLNESAMEYAIRCMDYFEVMALKVYEKLIEQPEPKRGSGVTTNQEAIHQLLTRYPNTKRQKLAELLGVSVQYISKAAKS